jgi:hypothetical protein
VARDPINNKDLNDKYTYGSLNRADAQRNRTVKSPVKLSNPLSSILSVAENQYDPNLTDSTGPYRAIVLRNENQLDDFTAADSQVRFSFFKLFKTGTSVRARILEYHHAAIPMPPSLSTDDGEHNFFIDMHDIFTNKEDIKGCCKAGDIVLVDYRDRKNKKDPILLSLISSAEQEISDSPVSATEAVEEWHPPMPPPEPIVIPNGAGYNPDPRICGGNVLTYAECKTGRINGRYAKLHPQVYDNFEKLVNDAKSQGIELYPGSTFRSNDEQLNLRRGNCKYTNEQELKFGNATCDPSTAPLGTPGTKGGSRHLFGEAIDVANSEGTLGYKKSTNTALGSSAVSEAQKKAIKWLLANCSKYSLINYSGEAWHYSTDGR